MAKRASAGARPKGVRRILFVLFIAGLLVVATGASLFYIQQAASVNQTWLDQRADLSAQIALLTKVSREASQGLEPDFRALTDLTVKPEAGGFEEGQRDFGSLIDTFRIGDSTNGMPPLPGEYQEDVAELRAVWDENLPVMGAILDNSTIYQGATSAVAQIIDGVRAVRTSYEQVPASGLLTLQLLRLERMLTTARALIGLGPDVGAVIADLQTLRANFERGHQAIKASTAGPSAGLLDQAGTDFEGVAAAVDNVVGSADDLAKYQEAAGGFLGASTSIITAGNAVEQDIIDALDASKIDTRLPYLLGALAVLALIVVFALFVTDARRRANEATDRDSRQQKAILDLLNEITGLADGDLTVTAKVSEDFTGAIADSINYTIGSMRGLVGTINATSTNLASAASKTSDIARKLTQASERQAKEVVNVTTAIVASSQQLDQVAGRAEKLAADAQASVQVAHSGAQTVNRTIQNMGALREQIQDTSKRIKRLGESSQEIGNIIEFINDIAEQTNTLALNASIQAAMAGEQGRGFAVVADEVQRLAERAANATRQIESLVKTIQADTTEAIISMERSTSNVVSGAKSAEEAGQALTQVEGASNDLARLIQEISGQARSQSAAASKIAGTMQVIRDIAVQTSGSAGQTADAVGNLTLLSDKLRESVSGFKLPGDAASVYATAAFEALEIRETPGIVNPAEAAT